MVLGCDPATTLIALADDEGHTASAPIAQLDRGSARLQDAYTATLKLASSFLDGRIPDVCFIEQPAGIVHPALWQAFGTIRAALWGAMADLDNHPVSVLPIMPSEWKATTLTNGSATKDQILAWAIDHGYRGQIQDEADAYGIAVAGAKLLGVTR
jgi:Holliday junction resolvasome RuvABC endonuclease subunit